MRECGYLEFQLGVCPTRRDDASGRLHENLDVFSYLNKKQHIFARKEIPFDTCTKSVGSNILPWDLEASVSRHPLEVKDHFPFWSLIPHASELHLAGATFQMEREAYFLSRCPFMQSVPFCCSLEGLSPFSYSTRVIFLQSYHGAVARVFSFIQRV